MVGRSLKATPAGIEKASIALTDRAWSREDLAKEVCDRQTVIKFFSGKTVDRKIFVQLCQKLELNWQTIAGMEAITPQAKESEANEAVDIDALVQQARSQINPYIQERCGSMRVLDMTQSIELDDIYIRVNILERITGRRGLGQAELLEDACLENFNRFQLGAVREKRVSGLEAVEKYRKLMILGKPGAGKTTFLKHLAIACNTGKFEAQRVPIFVTLKEFAEAKGEPDLLTYLDRLPGMSSLHTILQAGRSLILLDGLDEVREVDSSRVLTDIQQFSDRFCGNQIVITCRIAAREYTFQRFTEVEVADFDNKQIIEFVTNWFACKKDEVKGKFFIEKLKDDRPIRELATSPLLLTLLCSVFEENGSFPANRSELYETGLDVLLKKWDVKRNIQRDEVYRKLSLKRKEDLLSQIAKTTFEAGNYFFKQKEVERQITAYIQNLPDASTDPEALQLDSEAVLKSIEGQHGLFVERARHIYSFSHLTFHEYFAARKVATSCNQYNVDDLMLQALASHITEKRWREVIVLTVGMLESSDCLLQIMKRRIDSLLAGDDKLQELLAWVKQRSESVEVPYKPAAVRAFYLAHTRTLSHALALALTRTSTHILIPTLNRALAIARDRASAIAQAIARTLVLVRDRATDQDITVTRNITCALDIARSLDIASGIARALAVDRALILALNIARISDRELEHKLQKLKDQLPNTSYENQENFEQWWRVNGQTWTEQLRSVMFKYREIGYDWQFSKAQWELLEQYYNANLLLVDCLNSECYVSRAVREEIEATLLLPIEPHKE